MTKCQRRLDFAYRIIYALSLIYSLQIRSLRVPYPLIQTIVLHNARHLIKSNNAVVVALEKSVYGLFPVPLGAQVLLVYLRSLMLSY